MIYINNVKINDKELVERLLRQWVIRLEYLNENEKETLYKIGIQLYDSNLEGLYKINNAILTNKSTYEENSIGIAYEKIEEKYSFKYQRDEINLSLKQMKNIIERLSCILEEIYPLGTVGMQLLGI